MYLFIYLIDFYQMKEKLIMLCQYISINGEFIFERIQADVYMATDVRIVKMDDVDPESMLDTGDRITDPYMTSFEFARLIGCRDFQLKNGDKPLVDAKNETNTLDIARKELYELVIPLVIIRTLPDGRTECWKVSELYIAD